ncbi:MAG: rhodanese-related sulfurtransferase [Rhodoglobus sp.]
MAVTKILLFYLFTPLADPEAVRLWQRGLCESLGLGGRIILSKDGINATVGGELKSVKKYLRTLREYAPFRDIEVKWSEGGVGAPGAAGYRDFPRLSVRVRDELVSFGAPGELRVDATGVVGGGTRLSPAQLHDLVAEKEVTFFDGRNAFEAQIGRFRDAVVPSVANTREFVAELESGAYDHLKSEPIVTYCTGGIRCEVLSSLMINRGFQEVYQLDGGIATYGATYGDQGLWEGSLYVFDGRMSVEFSPDAAVIGCCSRCSEASSRMQNCDDLACREQLVVCAQCAKGSISCVAHSAAAESA